MKRRAHKILGPACLFLWLGTALAQQAPDPHRLFEAGDFTGAAREFAKALEADPESIPLRFNLGLSNFYAGLFPEAAERFTEVLSRSPGHPHAHFMLGVLAKNDGLADAATRHFQAVLADDPKDAGTLYQLGQVETLRGDWTAAIARFRESLALEPDNASVLYNLARALMRSGQTAEGKKRMARFQELRRASAPPMMGAMSEPSRIEGKYAQPIR